MDLNKEKSTTSRLSNQRLYNNLVHADKLPSECLLCQKAEASELGHIIPKFVMNWLKKASKEKNFNFQNTKEKISDTLALRIMCKQCEQLFSGHEKKFTDNYFMEYYKKKHNPVITSDIYYFALSIAWRILASAELMKDGEDKSIYAKELKECIRAYLIGANQYTGIDMYIFHADDIKRNLPQDLYNKNLLDYSIRQGVFCHYFIYDETNQYATLNPMPLVHFKLGVYYVIIAEQGHLQSLIFKKNIQKIAGEGSVYILKYTDELLGFLQYISNGHFYEVVESAIPPNIKYNRVSLI